jgi:ketosteroid isomerase-like protein
MPRENVEIVLSGYEAVERRDYDRGLELLADDVLWDMTGLGIPDLAKVYRGHDGIREFWTSWLAAWEAIEFKPLAVEDHGDHVIVEVQQRNRGRASGVAVDFHYFQAFTVRNGQITASYVAETKGESTRAPGLREGERRPAGLSE